MEDKTLQLLDKHGVLVLPEDIEHSTYTLLLEALLHLGDKPLTLYCRGNGGSTRSAMAMVDLIRQHGNVTGLLPGEANSSHGIVFAACQHRFVYPHARLGIHKVSWDGLSTRIDNDTLRLIAEDYEISDRVNARILAKASSHSEEWWYDMIQKAGSGGLIHFHAQQIREVEMARPIEEYQTEKKSEAL
jgi:ATP-dependent protease ClpP protease subunit